MLRTLSLKVVFLMLVQTLYIAKKTFDAQSKVSQNLQMLSMSKLEEVKFDRIIS